MRLRFEMRFSGPPNWKLRKEATDMSIYTMFFLDNGRTKGARWLGVVIVIERVK